MKIFPIISQPLYQDRPENRHDASKTSKKTLRSNKKVYNIRNNTSKTNSDIRFLQDFYLVTLFIFTVLKKINQVFSRPEVVKFSFNKAKRLSARQAARDRKSVLQNTSEVIDEKQQNLAELVMDLEREDMEKPAPLSHHDIVAWVIAMKKREEDKLRLKAQRERGNYQIMADEYFEQLKEKKFSDARFLREKTFSNEGSQKATEADTADLQDLYEETKNLRRIVDVYNLQKMK